MNDGPGVDGQPAEPTPELAILQRRLRDLRAQSGRSLRNLVEVAHYSASALNRAETKPRLPRWEVVEGFVRACDGPVDEFRALWEAAGTTADDDPVGPDVPDPVYEPGPDEDPPRPVPPPVAPSDGGGEDSAGGSWLGAHWRTVVVLLTVVVLGVALGLVPTIVAAWRESCHSPAASRATASGATQCVGRVENSVGVRPEFGMGRVLDQISAQNAAIGSQPAVSVAYVLPLPAVPSSLSTELSYELGGVQLAQQRANQRRDVGGDLPKIRVLIYNTGEDNAAQSDLLSDIDAPSSSIVAVLGLGQSKPDTIRLVDELTRRLIATFPARATADMLTSGPTGVGLFRVTPLNKDLTAAAAAQLPTDSTVAVLEDANVDPYKSSLTKTFGLSLKNSRPDVTSIPLPSYDSSRNALGTAFDNEIIPSLCKSDADSVFVAGRGVDIEKFLIALGSPAQCTNRSTPITVITGDDGVDVLNQLRRADKNAPPDPSYPDDSALNGELRDAFGSGKFVYRYAALAHSDLWATPEFTGSREFNDALRPFDPQRKSNDPTLQEGAAIMGYDSAIAAIRCVRRAATQRDVIADPSVVAGACYQFNSDEPIYGASGLITFTRSGLAPGRLIPVVEVRPDGSAPVYSTYRSQ